MGWTGCRPVLPIWPIFLILARHPSYPHCSLYLITTSCDRAKLFLWLILSIESIFNSIIDFSVCLRKSSLDETLIHLHMRLSGSSSVRVRLTNSTNTAVDWGQFSGIGVSCTGTFRPQFFAYCIYNVQNCCNKALTPRIKYKVYQKQGGRTEFFPRKWKYYICWLKYDMLKIKRDRPNSI